MGLANLMPGISGGTMLLAAGVYTQFIEGIAEMTSLRFKLRTVSLLITIIIGAVLAIFTTAGLVKEMVTDHRWVMFSLFIGLTLGGVPVIWKLLRPLTFTVAISCVLGFMTMTLVAFLQYSGTNATFSGPPYLMVFLAGIGSASAMVLPGISGGYVLLIFGQYLNILGAIDDATKALTSVDESQWDRLYDTLHIFIPLGLGILIGVAVISNLIKFFLKYFRNPTLGVLLGLLLGAVLELWPFRQGVAPEPGAIIKGQVMTPASIQLLTPEDFPLQQFTPTTEQCMAAMGLITAGFLLTRAITLIGKRHHKEIPTKGAETRI